MIKLNYKLTENEKTMNQFEGEVRNEKGGQRIFDLKFEFIFRWNDKIQIANESYCKHITDSNIQGDIHHKDSFTLHKF